jgi:hypothetical protein
MDLDIEEVKRKIEDHFASITEEQFQENLIRAGIDVYTNFELDFLEADHPHRPVGKSKVVVEFGDEANSGCIRSHQGTVTIFSQPELENRPTYPAKERNLRSSNQDYYMKPLKVSANSSAEGCFFAEACL